MIGLKDAVVFAEALAEVGPNSGKTMPCAGAFP
jgi:hypothetical protein